jgi:hypothetical protein
MLTEAQNRGAAGWANVTPTFTAALDSYGQAWPDIVTERQVRYAQDDYWSVWQALAETGEVDVWLTPALELWAAPRQGATLAATLTAPQITHMEAEQAADPGSWVAALTHDGWISAQSGGPRREYGLQLGTAISRPVGRRVLSAAFANRSRWDSSIRLTGAPLVPAVDFQAGDTLTVTYEGISQQLRILSLSGSAGGGGVLWEAELTDLEAT